MGQAAGRKGQRALCVAVDEDAAVERIDDADQPGARRGRGSLVGQFQEQIFDRPAWVGNTMGQKGVLPVQSVHPRVGGEHRTATPAQVDGSG